MGPNREEAALASVGQPTPEPTWRKSGGTKPPFHVRTPANPPQILPPALGADQVTENPALSQGGARGSLGLKSLRRDHAPFVSVHMC